LRNNNIHILGYIYFWIIIAIISLMFLVLICGGCIFCVAAVTEENGKSQSQRQSESQSQSENMVLDKI